MAYTLAERIHGGVGEVAGWACRSFIKGVTVGTALIAHGETCRFLEQYRKMTVAVSVYLI